MGISDAFNTSRIALATTGQWAELVSGNIANADNPNYGRRTLARATLASGAVIATGIRRETNSSLNRMYREELGRLTRQDTVAGALATYTASLGGVEDQRSPAKLLTAFQTNLDLLHNTPSDSAAQQATVQAAQSLTLGLNKLDRDLGTAMRETTTGLKDDLRQANDLLTRLADLNGRVMRLDEGSGQRATIDDQINAAVNELAALLDFQAEYGPGGDVSLMTTGGVRLLDEDQAFALAWNQGTGVLTAGGQEITPGVGNGLTEGTIAGRFELLTEVYPTMQLQLDDYARALIEGFTAADATVAPGQPGLFTDAGAAFTPPLEGLAGRIAVNAAVRPDAGGAFWRIRDGMGAATQGPQGSAGQIGAFIDMLDAPQGFDPDSGLPTGVSLATYAAALVADQQSTRGRAQDAAEGLMASASAMDAARLNAQGVNIDDELQQLLLIEKGYAANSQVVSTLSDMLDSLLAAV